MVLNRVANPVTGAVLRTRAGWVFGRLAALEYIGRRSGDTQAEAYRPAAIATYQEAFGSEAGTGGEPVIRIRPSAQ